MGAGIWGEPLNLVTNLFFIIAAAAAYKKVKASTSPLRQYLFALAITIGIVGAGSALFHAAPNRLTIWFDTIPIYVFLLLALALLLKCLTASWRRAIALCALYAFVMLGATFWLPADFLNGSFRHAITLVIVMTIVAYAFKWYKNEASTLLAAVLVYGAAIVCRSIDAAVCGSNHMGTHFLWHTLNAVAAYIAIISIIKISMASKLKV